MRERNPFLFSILRLGTPIVIALAVIIALAGPSGFGRGDRNAEAAFMLELKKLLSSDIEAGDLFGNSVAVSGDTAIVGACCEDTVGIGVNTGAAYVLQRDEGGADNWGEVTKLVASSPGLNYYFGASVAVSGDTAVVGTNREEGQAGAAGAAYIFQRHEGGADNWGEVKRITSSDIESSDRFGGNVGITGDTVVVGANGEDAGGSSAGAAYVFQRDEGGTDNWGEVKKLTASDAEAFDSFGSTVAVGGDTAVVGASDEDSAGSRAGAAYVFQRDQGGASNWGEVKKLTASDAETEARFGNSVALSGDTAIVGAPGEDAGGDIGDNFGAAYVFQRDQGGASNWGEVKKLTASDAVRSDDFGASVGLSGDTAIVGATGQDVGDDNTGAAYAFVRDSGGANNWGEEAKLTASDGEFRDLFGASAAVDANTALVGASQDNAGGEDAGAAYVFDLVFPKPTPTNTPTPTATPVTPTITPTPTLTPTSTKLPDPGDTDLDGCSDQAENGPDESFGDFYDVWTHPPGQPAAWERNKVINLFDILAVAPRFGAATRVDKPEALAAALIEPTDDTSYHAGYDRGPIVGANPWDRAPADGVINITDDILGVAAQFGHDCS